MSDVFISYKRERSAHAERLAIILEAYGFEVWWDYQLIGGDRFRTTIEQEITKTRAVVVLWDTDAINSAFVIDEADLAQRQNKLLQVVLEDVQPPMGFRSADHRLSLVGWSGGPEHDAVARVVGALATMTGKDVRRPTLLVGALSASLGRLPAIAMTEAASVSLEPAGPNPSSMPRTPDHEALREDTFFQSCGSAEEFEVYLNRYPDGHFAELARAKIAALDRAWVKGLGISDDDWGLLDGAAILKKLGPRSARAEIEPIARRGGSEALTILGIVASRSGDDEEAARLYRVAAEKGFSKAQANLAQLLSAGRGVPRDLASAFEWTKKAALSGNAIAQSSLGLKFELGTGTVSDLAQANKWYRKAAEQGLAVAQSNLANGYQFGRGLDKDPSQAATWYRRAAEQGDQRAQLRLGQLLQDGEGVRQDEVEGSIWIRKAAEQGYSSAQFALAYSLVHGRGVQKDHAEAVLWYRRAAMQGDSAAQNNLGTMYELGTGVAKNHAEAAQWYEKAVAGGNALAKSNLGELLEQGEGVPKDLPRAVRLFQEAADAGTSRGQFNFGRCLENGIEMASNLEEAIKWYEKSADQGFAEAAGAVQRLKGLVS
jgi:TPR repeat protein